MFKPEIARRCPVCGASIREAAFFCPQCGEELAQQKLEENQTTSVITTPLTELSPARDETKPEDQPPPSEAEEPAAMKGASKPTPDVIKPIKETTASNSRAGKPPPGKAQAGKVRNKIQRATTLARDVEGDVLHRVQKVRQISSVVLDEAGYDPSLRFVLVAAALFLLFLLVLVLNKLIG